MQAGINKVWAAFKGLDLHAALFEGRHDTQGDCGFSAAGMGSGDNKGVPVGSHQRRKKNEKSICKSELFPVRSDARTVPI